MTSAQDFDESLATAREAFEKDPDYVAAGIATDIAEQVARRMSEKDMSRSALAQALGVNRAYITRVLNAPPNLTLRSIAAIALALDAIVRVQLVPVEGGHKAFWAANTAFGESVPNFRAYATANTESALVEAPPMPPQKPDFPRFFGAYLSTTDTPTGV